MEKRKIISEWSSKLVKAAMILHEMRESSLGTEYYCFEFLFCLELQYYVCMCAYTFQETGQNVIGINDNTQFKIQK